MMINICLVLFNVNNLFSFVHEFKKSKSLFILNIDVHLNRMKNILKIQKYFKTIT